MQKNASAKRRPSLLGWRPSLLDLLGSFCCEVFLFRLRDAPHLVPGHFVGVFLAHRTRRLETGTQDVPGVNQTE